MKEKEDSKNLVRPLTFINTLNLVMNLGEKYVDACSSSQAII